MFLLLEPYLRILYAGLLGAIGWEREVSGKAAGLRTLIIVAVSSGSLWWARRRRRRPRRVIDWSAPRRHAQGWVLGQASSCRPWEVRGLTTARRWCGGAGLHRRGGMYLLGLFVALALYATLRWPAGGDPLLRDVLCATRRRAPRAGQAGAPPRPGALSPTIRREYEELR